MGKYMCENCGKEFAKASLLKRHKTVHTKEMLFACNTCDKRFSQKSSLQRHQLHQHDQQRQHKCKQCTMSFAQRSNLKLHLQRAHSAPAINKPTNQCPHCACAYSKLNILNRHIKMQHTFKPTLTKSTFSDDSDPSVLVQNVLDELRQLQKGMLMNCTEVAKENSTEPYETPTSTSTLDSNVVEDAAVTNLTTIKDKLNPQKNPKVLQIQLIQRVGETGKSFICHFCGKEFKKSYDYLRHRRTHTQERPYTCSFCESSFQTKNKLQAHLKIHNLNERTGYFAHQFACSLCPKQYVSQKKSKRHMESHSTNLSNDWANKKMRKYSQGKNSEEEIPLLRAILPEPINLKPPTKQKSLSPKNKSIPTPMEEHNKTNTKLKPYICIICGRRYGSKSTFTVHQRIHTNSLRFCCPRCPLRTFNSKAQLQRHMLYQHSKERNYRCVYCERTFKTRENCRSHMLTHLKRLLHNDEPSVTIKKLTATDSQAGSFPKSQSNQEKQKNSEVTGQFGSKSNSSCHICGKDFKKAHDLTRHERTHTKERPFGCTECPKHFALKSTLQDHQLTHLPNRATFSCQVCGKSLSSKRVLKLHLRLHTGERPFNCPSCTASFRTSGHQLAHIKVAKHEGSKFWKM